MIRAITDGEVEIYFTDGVVCLNALFAPDWVAGLAAGIADPEAVPRFATEGALQAIAERILGSPMRLLSAGIEVDAPSEAGPVLWQHDDGDHLLSVRIALDPVGWRTGGVEYVAGSQRWPGSIRETYEGIDPPALAEVHEAFGLLSWNLEPGDCVVHQALVVHGDGGNRTDAPRHTLIARFGA